PSIHLCQITCAKSGPISALAPVIQCSNRLRCSTAPKWVVQPATDLLHDPRLADLERSVVSADEGPLAPQCPRLLWFLLGLGQSRLQSLAHMIDTRGPLQIGGGLFASGSLLRLFDIHGGGQ